MRLHRVMIIFGTRPEAIKMAPVVKEFQKHPRTFEQIVCVSAQHRQMLDQVLSMFCIKPDIDLNIMTKKQSLEKLTGKSVNSITNILREVRPHLIFVQGDTTTAMCAALAGFYQKIPVAHVEAGLRTKDIYYPFPEEANRRIISILAMYHFAPTRYAYEALKRERGSSDNIYLTGNTVVDALKMILKKTHSCRFSHPFDTAGVNKLILVTAHRRENFGRPLRNICVALREIVKRNKGVEIVYPVHMNPEVKVTVTRMLGGITNINLVKPLDYIELIQLLKKCSIVLTDSGGIQEEAPALGKPVLVLRNETERPEGIEAGVAKLVGTDTGSIVKNVEILLHNSAAYRKMSQAVSPYGDGKAARRIVAITSNILKGLNTK